MSPRAAAFLVSAWLCAGAVPTFAQWTPQSTVVLRGKVVSLNGNEEVRDGQVVIKGGKIVSILAPGAAIPAGALVVETQGYIYPGLMDLHNHMAYNFLKLYEITGKPGRPGHTTNHDQWPSGPNYAREVNNPTGVVTDYYGFISEAQKFAEVRALIGGTTAIQGEDPKGRGPIETTLVRNVNLGNFGRSDQDLGVGQNALGFSGMDYKAFGELTAAEEAAGLPLGKAAANWRRAKQRPKAFILHLAEGIDEVARREYIDESFDLTKPIQTTLSKSYKVPGSGQPISALAEAFGTTVDNLRRINRPALDGKTFVSGGTTIKVPARKNQPGVGNLVRIDGRDVPFMVYPGLVGVHCTALKESDFLLWERHLKSLGATGTAAQPKVVWSPLSNMLLYGNTTDIRAARKANALIAMGSDWSPSGTKNMLWELKVADEVNSQWGKPFTRRELIEMATVNGAKMLGWESLCGRVAPGLFADLIVVDAIPGAQNAYDNLIMAGEANMQLVLVGGDPVYGDQKHLDRLKVYEGRPRYELLPEFAGDRPKGIDMLQDPSRSRMSLQEVKDRLAEGLRLDPAEMTERVNAPGNGTARRAINDKLGRGKVETPVTQADVERFLKAKFPLLKPIGELETLRTDEEFLAAVERNVHWQDPAKYPLPTSLNLRQYLDGPTEPVIGAAEALEGINGE